MAKRGELKDAKENSKRLKIEKFFSKMGPTFILFCQHKRIEVIRLMKNCNTLIIKMTIRVCKCVTVVGWTNTR